MGYEAWLEEVMTWKTIEKIGSSSVLPQPAVRSTGVRRLSSCDGTPVSLSIDQFRYGTPVVWGYPLPRMLFGSEARSSLDSDGPLEVFTRLHTHG